jgi:hypothetical protein
MRKAEFLSLNMARVVGRASERERERERAITFNWRRN